MAYQCPDKIAADVSAEKNKNNISLLGNRRAQVFLVLLVKP